MMRNLRRNFHIRFLMSAASRVAAAVFACAVQLAAQTPSGISGSVYDSLSYAPLARAVVQVVRAPQPGAPEAPRQTWTALTDSLGEFRLSLPKGHYFVGFQHPTLSALGLESPVKAVDVSEKPTASLQLAIPSARTVGRLLCPGADSAHSAVITGTLRARAATTDWKDADVTAEWGDVAIKDGRLIPIARQQQATISDDGLYRICGVKHDGSLRLSAHLKGFHPIEADLPLEGADVVRRDLHLVPLAERHGAASVVLRVTDSTQTRSLAETVSIPELQRQVVLSAGTDTLRDLPEGSWALHIRALGYAPRELLVDADMANTVLRVRLIPIAQNLAPVRVIARRDQRVLDDIDERMRVAAGTLIRAGDPFLATASYASDAIRAGRGFIWKGPTRITTGRPTSRGGVAPCSTTVSNTPPPSAGPVRSRMEIAIYLDGSRVPGGLETLNNMIQPDDILAIETYPEVLSAPFLWRTSDACAVVAFWTKHRAGS